VRDLIAERLAKYREQRRYGFRAGFARRAHGVQIDLAANVGGRYLPSTDFPGSNPCCLTDDRLRLLGFGWLVTFALAYCGKLLDPLLRAGKQFPGLRHIQTA
jgi:hypothetical protein